MKDIKIAAVTVHSPVGELLENIEKTRFLVREAKKRGVKIVCFPELNITGYGIHPEMTETAVTVPGPETETLVRLAKSEDTVILAGMVEKDDKGRIFATHLIVEPEGVKGKYRKLHIAPPERGLFSAGNDIPVFESLGLRFGIQLCYDAHFPELSTAAALKGADVLFMPHASPRGNPEGKFQSWMRHLTARAYDNSVFVIACNQTGENGAGLSFPGVAAVLDPTGSVIEKYTGGKESMLVAELKADVLCGVRNHPMRYFLPNRRPGVYAEKVNK